MLESIYRVKALTLSCIYNLGRKTKTKPLNSPYQGMKNNLFPLIRGLGGSYLSPKLVLKQLG